MAKKFKQTEAEETFQLATHFKMLCSEPAESTDGAEVITIEGYCNFSGECSGENDTFIDRVGDVVVPAGIELANYKKSPVILFQHDRDDVIGKALTITKKKDGLFIKAEIHQGACEEDVFYAIKNGLYTSFSIGFRTKKAEWKQVGDREVFFITKSELLEVSVVSIPANVDSTFTLCKSFDGNIYAGELEFPPQAKLADVDSSTKSIESSEDATVKLKLRDLLTADKVKELEDLGLGSTLDELKEVDTKSFIAGEISKHLEAFKEEIKTLIAEAVKPAEPTKGDEESSEKPAGEEESTEESSTEEGQEETKQDEVSAEDIKSLSDAIETLKSLASAE